MHENRNTGIQEYRNTGIKEYQNTWIGECNSKGLQKFGNTYNTYNTSNTYNERAEVKTFIWNDKT